MIFEVICCRIQRCKTNSDLAKEVSQSLRVSGALKVVNLLSLHHQAAHKLQNKHQTHHNWLHHRLDAVKGESVETSDRIQQLTLEGWHMHGLVLR